MGKLFFLTFFFSQLGLTSAIEGHGKRAGSRVRSRHVDLGAKFGWKYHQRVTGQMVNKFCQMEDMVPTKRPVVVVR